MLKSTPLFSVVLPTYNRAKTLARAIDSVLAQTCKDFELIVVVDASPDETAAVLGRYSSLPNVRIIASTRGNCSAARNIGVAASRSPYVAFQDSDDEWLPTLLEKAAKVLADTGPEVGVFYSDMTRVLACGKSMPFISPEISRGGFINEDTLDFQVYGLGIQATVIKRDCFQRAWLFDEAIPRFVDLELFIRLADQFEFIQRTWMLNPGFAALHDETDPLMGPKGGFTIPAEPVRMRVNVDTFVRLAGGEYFFLPSLPALNYLAQL